MTRRKQWQPYFVWWPAYVDAYDVSEIKDGKMQYLKFGEVERRFCTWIDVDDEDRIEHCIWRFRLPRASALSQQQRDPS